MDSPGDFLNPTAATPALEYDVAKCNDKLVRGHVHVSGETLLKRVMGSIQ
jgi:hypothetical protein